MPSIAPVFACCLGDDDKHHLHKDGINGALKTKANAGSLKCLQPDLLGVDVCYYLLEACHGMPLLFEAFRSFEEAKVLFQDEAARIVGRTSRDASVRLLGQLLGQNRGAEVCFHERPCSATGGHMRPP